MRPVLTRFAVSVCTLVVEPDIKRVVKAVMGRPPVEVVK